MLRASRISKNRREVEPKKSYSYSKRNPSPKVKFLDENSQITNDAQVNDYLKANITRKLSDTVTSFERILASGRKEHVLNKFALRSSIYLL